MLAGFSYPDATAKQGDQELEKWLDLSMKFIASEYGDQLHTAVLHLDESHPHVHFYVIPRDYEMAAACGEIGHQRDGQETRSQEGHAIVPRRLLQPSLRPMRAHEIRPTPPASDAGGVEGTTRLRYENCSSGECGARFRRAEGEGGSQEPPSCTERRRSC